MSGKNRSARFAFLAILALGGALAVLWPSPILAQSFPSTAADQPASVPWWDDFPLITQGGLAVALAHNSTIIFGGGGNDPTWGIYFQRSEGDPPRAAIHDAGLKCLAYYETFGTISNFAVELGNKDSLDFTPIMRTQWSWTLVSDKGGPIRWVGPQNYFDAPEFTGIYNRLHPRYGGRAMTYPDGSPATGYMNRYPGVDGDLSADPRNSRVLDASCAKNLLGEVPWDFGFNESANTIDPKTGKPYGPIRGLFQAPNGKYPTGLSAGKDSACPFWADMQHASALYGADRALDGIWSDNYSAWDSYGYPPVALAFGDWSVARFRDHLKKNFTAAQLTAMGVTDVNTFDVRAALRAKLKAWGGTDTNLGDARWNDARWLDDPIWRAYKIHKRQVGTEGLTDFYTATKSAAAEAGVPEFLVQGNDIPFYSLGWTRETNMDMVSTEMSAGWHMGAGSRGVMLPPVGRFAPIYKLAREHARSRFVNVWFYIDAKYKGREAIANVLDYEMLANHTLPMHYPSNPAVIGDLTSNSEFFQFVKDNKATFGLRMPVSDIGIYYSSSSTLAFMTPNGFLNMDAQPHQFAVYGWGTALGELHYQYRVIPEWKLTREALDKLRVLIIPNADVLDKGDVTNIIDPWVRAGGLLIVTGNSGYRKNEAGNFDPDPAGFSLAGLTGVSVIDGSTPARKLQSVGAGKVLYTMYNLGLTYYNYSTASARALNLNQFKQALDDVLAGQAPAVLTTDAPGTLGLNVYEDARARRLFIDANSVEIDLANDAAPMTSAASFSVLLPDWLRGLKRDQIRVRVLSPMAAPSVSMSLTADNRAQINLGSFQYYASVVLERLDHAADWQGYH